MVKFAMMTDPGSRENNEDYIGMYQDEDSYCFVLADGLGGHGKGEVASQLAVDTAVARFCEGNRGEAYMDTAFETAQKVILRHQSEDRACMDMKTTLVVLEVEKDQCLWGHIGDSRLYYFHNGRIRQRTLDHSVPQMLVAIGEIREKDIRHHPDRNRLLKVLGVETDEFQYQLAEPVEREGRQAFLLCSDGFWELIEERKMESTYRHAASPEDWLSEMKKIVLKNGRNTSMDNFSAIAVWID